MTEKIYSIYARILVTISLVNVIVMTAVRIFLIAIMSQFIYYCVNDPYYYTTEIINLSIIAIVLMGYELMGLFASKLLNEVDLDY